MFPSWLDRLISQYLIPDLNYKALLLNKGTEEKRKIQVQEQPCFLIDNANSEDNFFLSSLGSLSS